MMKRIDIQKTMKNKEDYDEVLKVLQQTAETLNRIKEERPTSVKFWLTINEERNK